MVARKMKSCCDGKKLHHVFGLSKKQELGNIFDVIYDTAILIFLLNIHNFVQMRCEIITMMTLNFSPRSHTHKQNKSIKFDRIRTCRMNFDWIRTFFFAYNHTRNRLFIHLEQMCTYFLKFDKTENYFETGKQRSNWSKFESSAFLHNCPIWRLFATAKRIASHIKSIQSTHLCIFQHSKDIRSKYSQRKYWKSDPRDSQY